MPILDTVVEDPKHFSSTCVIQNTKPDSEASSWRLHVIEKKLEGAL